MKFEYQITAESKKLPKEIMSAIFIAQQSEHYVIVDSDATTVKIEGGSVGIISRNALKADDGAFELSAHGTGTSLKYVYTISLWPYAISIAVIAIIGCLATYQMLSLILVIVLSFAARVIMLKVKGKV